MKVECPECKELTEPAWMRGRAGGDLEIKCGACGIVSVAPVSEVAPEPVPAVEKGVTCPKCSHLQRNQDACDRCGLIFSRWDPERAAAATDEAARALWQGIDAAWEDDARHRAFLEYCTSQGLYAYAAQQYSAVRRDPGRGERAATQLGRLVVIAQQALDATKPGDRSRTARLFRSVILAMAFALCAGMLLFVLSRVLG